MSDVSQVSVPTIMSGLRSRMVLWSWAFLEWMLRKLMLRSRRVVEICWVIIVEVLDDDDGSRDDGDDDSEDNGIDDDDEDDYK